MGRWWGRASETKGRSSSLTPAPCSSHLASCHLPTHLPSFLAASPRPTASAILPWSTASGSPEPQPPLSSVLSPHPTPPAAYPCSTLASSSSVLAPAWLSNSVSSSAQASDLPHPCCHCYQARLSTNLLHGAGCSRATTRARVSGRRLGVYEDGTRGKRGRGTKAVWGVRWVTEGGRGTGSSYISY